MEPKIYILKNEGLEVHVSDFGATLVRMIVADKKGRDVDVLLGMEQAADYTTPAYCSGGAYLGAVIGRYGNRIAGGRFELEGKVYSLAVNNGSNHLHGGICGFDKRMWTVTACSAQSLRMRYISPDGEEGYPGKLTAEVHFSLEGKALRIGYYAVCDRHCFVNLTHHPYFNLDPEAMDIRDHELKLTTDRYLHTNDLIPDGRFVTAAGDYNFLLSRPLKGVIDHCGGLDDCYVFCPEGRIVRMAELSCPKTGLTLYVDSDYPGLQVYTGRFLEVRHAKGGAHYGAFAGVALEAQFWPDSPHHPEFPSALLAPGEEYRKTTIYGFMEA